MSRIFTCGYETGDINEAGFNTIAANHTLTVVGSTPTPRAGAYCLKVTNTSGASLALTYKSFALPAAKTEIWCRWAIFLHALTGINEFIIAGLQDAGGGGQACLTWSATDGLLRARLGTSTGGALLGTSGTVLPQDSWHVIEWREQILTATTGAAEVWLDGNRVVNFSGDTSSTATLNVQTLLLGIVNNVSSQVANEYVAFDDIAVNDTAGTLNNGRAGDGRIVLLTPSAAGSSTQFTRGGTDTGANFSQVNELPPSMGQYVGSSTVGQRDLYAMTDVGVAVSSINVVEAIALAQNSDAGGGSIAPTLKSGATINEATAIGLSTSAGYVTSRWETDPATSAAWTIAAVNALEAGATVR